MNILITGATGTVGRRLSAQLAGDGHRLTGLSRDPENAHKVVPSLSQVFRWDMSGQPPVESFDGIDAIVHLAGETVTGRWDARKLKAIKSSRVEGTRYLIDGLDASGHRPSAFISASAVGYYGERGEAEVDERDGPGLGYLAEVCNAWEHEASRAAMIAEREVRLRIGIVLDDKGGALAEMLPLFRKGLGGKLGRGQQWWPWIHIDDLTRLICFAIDQPLSGPFNAVSPNPARQKTVAATLGRSLRRPAILPVPGFALRKVLGGFAEELLMSRRVMPWRLVRVGFHFRFENLSEALNNLLAVDSKPRRGDAVRLQKSASY